MPSSKYKIHEQFMDGYKTGIEWPDIWESHGKPGGPWVCGSGPYSSPERALQAEQSRAENKAWREGWEDGYEEKLRTKRSNPPRT